MDLESFDQLLAQSQSLLIISLLISLACAVLCGVIAARRRARWVYWSVMGFASARSPCRLCLWPSPGARKPSKP